MPTFGGVVEGYDVEVGVDEKLTLSRSIMFYCCRISIKPDSKSKNLIILPNYDNKSKLEIYFRDTVFCSNLTISGSELTSLKMEVFCAEDLFELALVGRFDLISIVSVTKQKIRLTMHGFKAHKIYISSCNLLIRAWCALS